MVSAARDVGARLKTIMRDDRGKVDGCSMTGGSGCFTVMRGRGRGHSFGCTVCGKVVHEGRFCREDARLASTFGNAGIALGKA